MSILNKDQIKDVIALYSIKTVEDAHGAVKDLMKDVLERALDAELSNTLGYDKHDYRNKETTNSRNGSYKKNMRSSLGSMSLNIPRDRNGEHEPLFDKPMFPILTRELFRCMDVGCLRGILISICRRYMALMFLPNG